MRRDNEVFHVPKWARALKRFTFSHAEGSTSEVARLQRIDQGGLVDDLAVVSRDCWSVPVLEIGGIKSVFTVVGGRVVPDAAPFMVAPGP